MKEDFNRLFPDNRMDNLNEEPLRQAQLIAVRILKIVDHVCRKHGIGYWIDGGTLLGAVRNGKFIPWDDDIDIGMTREDYEKFLSIAVEELPDDLFVQNYSTTELAGTTWTQIKDRKSYIKIDNGANDHEGIFIDIFPFDSYSENSIKRFREMMYKTLYIKAFAVNAPLKKPYFQGINLAKNIAKILLKIAFFEFAIFDKNYIYKKNLETREKRIEALKGNPKTNYGYGTDVLNWDFVYKAEHVLPLKTITFEGYEFSAPNDWDGYLTTLYGSSYIQPPPEGLRLNHNYGIKTVLDKEEEEELNRRFQYKK